MKFRLSFKVHSSLFSPGSRYILYMPGVARFMAYDGMLKMTPFVANNTGALYISSDYLVPSGFNSVSIEGDDIYIKLHVNNYTFTLFHSTYVPQGMTYYNITNFNNYYGTYTFPTLASDEDINYLHFILKLNNPNVTYASNAGILDAVADANFRFTVTSEGYLRFRVGNPTFIDITASELLPQSTDVYVRVKYDPTADMPYTIAQSLDGTYWNTVAADTTTIASPGVRWSQGLYLGKNRAGSSYSLPASTIMYLYETDIEVRTANSTYTFNKDSFSVSSLGSVTIDNSLSLSNGLTKNTDAHAASGTPYPTIYPGGLHLYGNSWLVLKEIEAVKVEDDEQ